jgi:hypothetical protein
MAQLSLPPSCLVNYTLYLNGDFVSTVFVIEIETVVISNCYSAPWETDADVSTGRPPFFLKKHKEKNGWMV